MPRPIELTDEISTEIAKHLIRGCSIADAAALAGIAESTYHAWIKRGEAGEEPFAGFSELCRAARADARRRCVKTLIAAAREGDWKAAIAFLARSDPDNWGQKDRVKAEHSGELTIKVEYDIGADGDDQASPPAPGPAEDPPRDPPV